MKSGGWVPLDKSLVGFLPKDRPYTILEAMFSYSKDVDENNENSINGYARIWSWSRCKVRRFVTDCKTVARHVPDRDETGTRQEVRYIFNNLEEQKDNSKTGARQGQDRGETTTTNPNPKPNPKPKPKPLPPEEAMMLASLLADLMLGNNPKSAGLSTDEKKKDAVERWASDIEKLHRLDHQSWEDIQTVIKWSQQDSFWRGNILSGATLRSKYDQMSIRALNSEPVIKHKYGNPIFDGGI